MSVEPRVRRVINVNSDGLSPTAVVAVNGASALTVLAAGAVGVKHRIYKLLITTDTAGTLTLSDGFGSVYLAAANSTAIMDFGSIGKLQTTAATAITLTNSAGGNVSAHGLYSSE